MMSDLIDRQAAIDVLRNVCDRCTIGDKLYDAIIALPSAQPEKRTEERTKTHACDCISREAAIDALDKIFDSIPMEQTTEILILRRALRELPPAQPEIIRCRECKHWREGDAYSYCQKLFDCGVLDVYDYMREEDDFCSLAERREDD